MPFLNKKSKEISLGTDMKTIISEGMVLKTSEMSGSGDANIEGIFIGNIDIDGSVVVGDSGNIVGDITAKNVLVGGRIEGNIHASGCIHLREEGEVSGNISCLSLVVDKGAVLHGLCSMDNKKLSNKN